MYQNMLFKYYLNNSITTTNSFSGILLINLQVLKIYTYVFSAVTLNRVVWLNIIKTHLFNASIAFIVNSFDC